MMKSLNIKSEKILFLIVAALFISSCFSMKGSINNVWEIPNTDLRVVVEKEKPDSASSDVTRKMILQEKLADKIKIDLTKGSEIYSRINVYQIGKNEYILRDDFEIYILDTQAKTLIKTSSTILSMTFEDTQYPKFIGAFDDNKNGNWQYLPASERAEIPLTKMN